MAAKPRRSRPVIRRVKAQLAALGDYAHLCVKRTGTHLLIAQVEGAPLARLTRLGEEAWGLSFRDGEGRWEPILLVDGLDGVVTSMSAALDVAAA